MSNKLDNFISRLSKAKRTGNDSYIACCPAHADKSPSMTVREVEDGMLLVHCFAGCGIDDIAGAIGFSISDLMPDKQPDELRKSRRIPFSPSDVLACAKNDAALLYVVMCDLDKGILLTEKQVKEAKKSAARIYSAANMGGANNG
jgi:hypothetical protein